MLTVTPVPLVGSQPSVPRPESPFSGTHSVRPIDEHVFPVNASIEHALSPRSQDWRPSNGPSYCYALGLYLGDGHITVRSARSASLIISLDRRYPAIVHSASQALAQVFPDVKVSQYHRAPSELMLVRLSHPTVPLAFPQHGPGKKHTRPIELAPWQPELTARHPEALLRGLIHSDGCRTVNRFRTKLPSGRTAQYEYPRYFFSNLSGDIRRIFTDHCEQLGIRWTQSNPRNVSISHRTSVARLDEFVGSKT
jgi:hypothetical protein